MTGLPSSITTAADPVTSFSTATFGGGMIVGARISASAILVGFIGVEMTPWLEQNGYLHPGDINSRYAAQNGIFPNFDCNNTGASGDGTVSGNDPQVSEAFAPCVITKDFPSAFGGERGPQVFADP